MFKKFVLKSLCVLSLFAIFTNCQIGLGESVDTDAPSGEITSPGVNAVIRDAFAIKGDWKDDGSVTQVKVNLRNTITRESADYNSVVNRNGSWSCAIDPEDESQPLYDGKYLATITLIDDVGHSTVLTRSYTIDNTPPVVILSHLEDVKDVGKAGVEVKTYGRVFSLNGKAADDNNIANLEVRIYGDAACNNELLDQPVTKHNIALTIEQNVASFNTPVYDAIYGSNEKGGTKQLYCRVWAYDEAQRYPVDGSAQTEEDKLGNCQKNYYLQKTLETTKANGKGLDEYSTNDLYAMFNNTYTTSSQSRAPMTASEIAAVLKELNGIGIDVGTFKINPKNNPYFTVIGLNNVLYKYQGQSDTMLDEAKKEAKTGFQVTNGDSESGVYLQININPGLDGYSILNDSVKYYLQECDEKGNVYLEKDAKTEKMVPVNSIPLGEGGSSLKTKPLSTVNYVDIPTGKFETGRYYRVVVEGTDTKENTIDSDYTDDGKEKVYAFYLAAHTGGIEIYSLEAKPDGKATDYVTTTTDSKVVTDLSKDYRDLNVKITYSYTGNSDLYVWRKFDNNSYGDKPHAKGLEKDSNAVWSEKITAEELKGHKTVTYLLKSEDGVNFSRDRAITLKIDDTNPVILNDDETPITKPEAKDTSNTSFQFTGQAKDTDSGVAEVWVRLENTEEDADGKVKTYEEKLNTTEYWTFTVIKDGKITDEKNPSYGGVLATEGEKKAVFWAIDKVGLKSKEVTVDWTYKDTKPELKLTGYKVDGEKDEGKQIDLMSSEGEFAVGKKFTLNGITKDEYGVEKITIVQTNAETGVAEEPIVITAENKNNWTAQGKEGIVWTLPELPLGGVIKNQTVKYKYQFTVTDKAGLNYGSKVLTVTVDDSVTKPCEIDTPVLKSFGEKALSGPSYPFGGTYDTAKASVIGIKTIKYAITKLGEAPIFNNETAPEGGSWSFVKSLDPSKADSLAEGKYTLYVKAIDGANKESEVTSRDFCVDLSKPEVKIEVFKDSAEEALEADNGTYKINDDGSVKSFKLKISASDANGIAGVTVKNGEDAVRLTKDGDVWTSADFAVEGTYNFAIEVEDGSGNGLSGDEAVPGKKVNETVSVIFDKTAPEISVTNADEKADSLATWFTGTSSTYITGTSSDAGSGIKARTISIDGGEEQNVTNSDDWNYKLTLEGLAENDESAESFHTLTVKAVDAVGNSSEKTYYFRYDVGVPTLTVKSDKENINAEDKLTISGQVYDGASVDANRAVKALEITATKDGAAYTFKKDALTENKNLCGDYSYVIDGAKMDEGSYIFTIKATDFAKNDVTKTVSLVVDKTAPKISQIEADVTISSTADNSKKDGETKWYKTQTHSITVSAADTTAGAGIETVEWCTAASEGTDKEAEWQPLTKKAEGQYKGTVTFTSEGLGNKLYVRVTDKAGNSSKFATKAGDYVVFNIDTTKPALALSKVQIGSNDSKITNGTEYINNTASITLYGTYSNTISGVEALSFGKKDSAPALTEAFEYFAGEIPEGKAIETLSYLPYSSIKDKAKITYWKAKFENKDLTTGDLYVNGSSVAGLSTDDTKLFKLNKDTIAPNVRNIKLSTSSNKYKVYQPEQKELVFFVNNTNTSDAPQTFTIFGIAEDGNTDSNGEVTDSAVSGVAKVELAIEGLAKQSSTSASFSEVDLSKINGESTTATLTVTDNAGNSSEEKITIKVDNAGPKGVHALDSSENGGKDLYFRVGEQNRDDGVKTDKYGEVILDGQNNATALEGAPSWNAALDKDVGGKYSGNTFSNAEKIKLRGRYDDSESGVNLVYYKVYADQPDSNKTKDFLNNYERDATGYFSLSDKEETRRVFYTGAVTAFEGGEEVTFKPENGGTTSEGKNYTEISTNYKATLAGLNTGRNYIVLVAVDNVGNASLESVKHNGVVYDNYLINVDTQAPEITSDTKLVTNASKDLLISGSVQDNPDALKAGIKDVWVKYADSQKAEKKIKAEIDEAGKWTVSIASADLTALYGNSNQSKTVNFTAIATDNAGTGNTSSCNTTVVIDKTAPTVEINVASMNDADSATGIQINGTIAISGTAIDENGLSETEKMILECLESGKTEWKKLDEATAKTSWTFENIDTTALKDNTDYSFRVSATDSVGNEGKSTVVKATVNQDTDRPVIKFTNLKLENMSESSRLVMTSDELYGSVTDDDGVESLAYAFADKAENLKDSSWTTLALTNSSFTLKLEDGSKNLYFKVTDKGGNSFVTSSTDEYSLSSPKLVDSEKQANQYGYKNADSGKRSTVTYITVDTLPPEYGIMQFTKVSATPEWKNESEIDSTPVGGSQNKLNIRIPAYDVNGIASVVMKISGVAEKIEFTESTDSKDKTTIGTHTDVKYWLSGLITIPSDTASGTKACSITITDGSGKTSKDEFSILIDNKAPVVTADVLEDKDYDVAGTQINGTIEITGTASDENKLSATENMVLEYQKSGTEDWTKLADITSAESWTFANVDTTKLPDNTTYNFRISATDCVGNVGYSKSITAKVDQDTDRPVIKLTSVDLNKDGIKLESSGFRGTVSDDDGIPETLAYKLGANGKWIDSKDNGSNLQYTEDGAFYLTLDDGNFDVFFKVDGFESKVFAESYTPSADDLNGMVKLTDKNGNQIGYRSSEVKNTALTMTVDTTVPYLGDFEYSTDYDAANAKKAHWAKKDTISSVTLGGNTKKITVRVPAWDINKIDAENAYVEIPGVGNVKLTDSKEKAKVTEYPESTWWISETAEITDTGTKTCTVSVKDTFNKESTDSFKIKVDNEGPEITLNALKDADSSESGTQINGTISIACKTDDESGLSATEKMVLEYQKSGTEDWTKLADITSAESWTFKDIDTRTTRFIDTETYNFRVNATDRLGNVGYSNTVTATVDQDTDRPVIKFTNLDLRTLNASSRTLLGTTIFSGIVTDDDGVPASSTVAYKLNKDDTWHYATDSDSKLTYSDSDGSFILELDDGGYDVYFKADGYESNTFAESDTPSADDLNGMVKLTDKNGNQIGYRSSEVKNTALLMTIDTTDPFIGDYEYSTDYDEAKPEKATWTKKPVASTPVLGGTKNKLRIRVPAWDANGIDETKAVIKENNIEFGLTDSETNAELPAYPKATYWISKEIDLSGNSTVTKDYTISVEDKNERPNSSKFSVLVDNTKPVITIDNLANKINKKINITGKASDTDSELSATEKMILEYQEEGSEGWTKLDQTNSESLWTFSGVDTTNLSDNTTYSFRVSATDTVGNTGYSEVVKATVDQDSDRPVIKFTNISLEGMAENSRRVMNSKELYGSVTDDDGVQALYYQFADDSSWHELVLENGSFKLALKEDGSKAVNFKVVDKAGKDFITSNIDKYSLETPKLVDSEDKPNQYGYVGAETGKLQTVTYITVDTKAPDLGTLQFSRNYNDAEPTWSDKSSINITPFGGTKNKLKIRIPAWDANGISSVTMNIPGVGDVSFTEETNVSATVTDSDKVEHTDAKYWISDEVVIPNKNIEDGSKTCSVTVLDNSSKESKDSFSLLVDNTAPKVTSDSIKDADSSAEGTQINGIMAISGKATDDNGLGEEEIKLYYSEEGTEDWKEFATTDSASPWSFSSVNTKELKDNTAYNFRVSATDKTGNTGYSDAVKVYVDQDTDRPVIKLTTLALNDTGSRQNCENADISGTVSDDDGIPSSLEYRIGSTGGFKNSKDSGSALQYSVTDGSFYLTLEDGDNDVYFRVGDFETKIFDSTYTPKAEDLNSMVKITDKSGTQYGYKNSTVKATVLLMKVDTTAPYLGDFEFSTDYTESKATWKKNSELEGVKLGGTTNKLRIRVPAWDKNGISEDNSVIEVPGIGSVKFTDTKKNAKSEENKEATWWLSEEIDISALTSGTKECSVVVKDTFNRTSSKTFSVTVDNTAPSVAVSEETLKAGSYVNGIIEVKGTAEDSNGLSAEKIGLYYRARAAGEILEKVESLDGWTNVKEVETAKDWTFTEVTTGKLDGTNEVADGTEVYFTVTATDSLGNRGYSKPVAVVVDQDTDRPVIKFTNLTLKGMSKDAKLWQKTSAVYGSVSDDDGIKTLFYQFAEGDAKLEDKKWEKLAVTGGSFALNFADDGAKNIYFKVEDKAGNTFTSSEKEEYSLKSPKLTDAEENLFGYKGEGTAKQTVTYLKVDTKAPSIEKVQFKSDSQKEWADKEEISGTAFGENNKLTIRVSANDANGIASENNVPSLTLTVAGYSETVKFTEKDENWFESEEITLPKTMKDGKVECKVTVKDNAGKTNDDTFSIVVDNTAPEVAFGAIKDADAQAGGTQVNGEISLSGTASDANGLGTEQMVLYYRAKTAEDTTDPVLVTSLEGWTEVGKAAHADKWTFSAVDTTKLEKTYAENEEHKTAVYFTVAAKDRAGNQTYSKPVSAVIDQDTDRPVIKISNISLKGMTSNNYLPIETNTLYGNVSDDDGVAGLYYKIPSMPDYKEISLTNGSFTLANIPDGSQKISFKVKDNNGSEFESTAEYNLKAPKLLDSDSTANKFGYKGGNGNTFAYLKVDTKAPYLGELKFSTDYVAATETTAATGKWSAKADLSTAKFGGTTNKLRIKVPAWDANYIKENGTKDDEIYNFIKIPAKDGDVKVKLTYTTEIPAADEKDAVYKDATYYLSDEIDISALTSGTKSCSISVMDNSGKDKTSSATFTFEVDNIVPSVSMDSLTDADEATGTQINGTISITGKASDDNGISTDNIKLYFREKTASDTTDPKSVTSLDGWKEVTAALKVDENNSDKWTFSNVNTAKLDGTKEIADGKTVYFTVEAKDSLGNTGYSAPVAAVIDQDTDRPVIKFNDISLKGMSASNYFQFETDKLKGSVSDDDGVPAKLAYRFGATGDFIDSEATGSKLKYSSKNGSFTLAFEDGSKDLYFKVTDCGNVTKESKVVAGTFESSTSYSVTSPKLIDSEETPNMLSDGSTVTYIMIDTTAPSTRDTKFTKTPDKAGSWNSEISKASFGGSQNKFYMQQQAYDINGVKKVYLSVPVAEKDGKSDAITAWTYKDSSNNKTTVYTKDSWPTTEKCYESYDMTGDGTAIVADSINHSYIVLDEKKYTREAYIFPLVDTEPTKGKTEFHLWQSAYNSKDETKCKPVDVTNLASGTRIASLITFDGIKSSTATVTFEVDNTAPTITFASSDADKIKSGEITVSGSSDELGTISYTVSTDGTTKPSLRQKLTRWTGYTVSEDGSTSPKNDGTIIGDDVKAPEYTIIPNKTLSWSVNFDGNQIDTTRAHDAQLKNFTTTLGLTEDLNSFTNLVNFYVWIKIEDAVGNVTEVPHLVCVDPQGDRPTVTLSTPEEPGVSLGGTVKLYGTAEDPNGTVETVWVQLLSATHTGTGTGYGSVTKNESNKITNFEPKASDVTYWLEKGYLVYFVESDKAPVELKLASNKENTSATEYDSTKHSPAKCYIKANFSGSSWNLKINNSFEFDPTADAKEANDMAVRVYARDNDTNLSYAVTRYFKMDKDTPVISNVMLKQYGKKADKSTDFTNLLASQEVRSGMYVKGIWYLEFTATDNEVVSEIALFDSKEHETLLTDENATIVKSNNNATWTVRYVLPTGTGVGNFKRTIKATDATNHTGPFDVNINYDNEAPKLLTDTSSEFDISANVKQNQGFYKLYSKVSDASSGTPSGVKAVGFYFMRRKAADEGLIYDPMQKRAKPISTKDLTYSDGLYWMSGSVTCDDSGKITLSTGLADKKAYVHAGSYIKLKGVMYKIDSVNDVDVTISESHENVTEAQIALAQFVDNRKSEYEGSTDRDSETGYYTTIKNDDNDGMVEELGGTTSQSSWLGSIVSRNIPDGPIEIHYTAYDESLNYAVGIVGNKDLATYQSYTTAEVADFTGSPVLDGQYASYVYTYNSKTPAYISNNAPRLAGVTVAIDYTGSGKFEKATQKRYYYKEDTVLIGGKAEKKTVSVTSDLIVSDETKDSSGKVTAYSGVTTIKGKTWIIPEMVGGNGKLWYTYNIYSSGTNGTKTTIAKKSGGTDAVYFADGNEDYDEYELKAAGQTYVNSHLTTKVSGTSRVDAYIEHDTAVFATSGGTGDTTLDKPFWFDYTIYDSTETPDLTDAPIAATSLANNQKATISIAMAVEVNDSKNPRTVFNDLYWNSATDNSIYKDVNDTLFGHVELRSDLAGTDLGKAYGTTDDKVSGIVTFSGYAYDNKRLSSLIWGIKDGLGENAKQAWPQKSADNTVTYVSTLPYNASEGKWGTKSGEGKSATWSYSSGCEDINSVKNPPYYFFKVYDDEEHGAYLDENGHKVYWELTVDTSRVQKPGEISNTPQGVGDNLYVFVEATDSATLTTDMTIFGDNEVTTKTDVENIRPNYRVDVLPYITKITTRLAKKNKNNGTVYSRTALGHYPISSDESAIVLSGYNLAAGNADVTIDATSFTSRKYAYSVAGYDTINNMNNNNAHGAYDISTKGLSEKTKVANMYNRMPNNSTNYTLTDDVEFDVWEFKKAASPKSGKIAEPVMRINPNNQMIGFAFANGADSLSLPNRTNSYEAWQKNFANYAGINFVYDSNGYVHSISTGLDTEPNAGLAGYMQYIFSRWGGNEDKKYNWNSKYTAALESVGIPSGTYVGGKALTSNLIDVDRFGKPALAVSNNNRVYVAYYDGDNDQIRFRYSSGIGNTKTGRVGTLGQFSDDNAARGTIGTDNRDGADNAGNNNANGSDYNSHKMFEAHTDYYSLLAGKTQGQTQTDTGNGTSEFVALDVIPGTNADVDVVVIVWYDGSDLMYTYRYGPKDDTDCSSNGVNDKWAKPQTIFEGFGQYCTIKVDAQKGIHIAAYDRGGADLYYCYMPGYDKYANRKSALVDSYSQVGKFISLDTALVASANAYNVVPYITYYGDGFNGLPKLAYLPGGINKDSPVVQNGADDENETFTGNWEVGLIPTSSEVNEDNMNVALWKDTNTGVLTASTKPTNWTAPNITAAGTNTATWYGNGTSKLVVGYGITSGATGFIEIGQMK